MSKEGCFSSEEQPFVLCLFHRICNPMEYIFGICNPVKKWISNPPILTNGLQIRWNRSALC